MQLNKNTILQSAKNIGIKHNVSFNVIDNISGKIVQSHTGHNSATSSMLMGVGYYLIGSGILNQGSTLLSAYIPKYISLGTMGLTSQDADASGLPTGIADDYLQQCPGFSADGYGENGYDSTLNNGRAVAGLGNPFSNAPAINCELISNSFPRSPITFRDVLSPAQSEKPKTIDIIYSAMISTGALAQFRGDKDYIFITEAGLWSNNTWREDYENGLLAAYRIVPPDGAPLAPQILRVGKNQVVQVIWKVQIGSIEDI